MDRRLTALAGVLLVLAGAPALANDSSAELAAGGLVLTRNDAIEMRAEDLSISEKEVRVRYRFANTASADQQVLVAFPMPDINFEGYEYNISIPTEDPRNILGFSTTVDGKPVQAEVEQKVLDQQGRDRTALLASLKIPLAPHLRATGQALDRLSPADQKRILDAGLALQEEYDTGRGMERHLAPQWRLKTTYHWTQVFPAGREIVVEHRYKPSVGMSAGTSVGFKDFMRSDDGQKAVARYCMDQAFLGAVERARQRAGQDFAPYFEKRISYVLSSGANWKAPIGDFRLTVDKGKPEAIVSFCGEGVKKVGPTRFEVRKSNFRPDRDLHILILEPVPAN